MPSAALAGSALPPVGATADPDPFVVPPPPPVATETADPAEPSADLDDVPQPVASAPVARATAPIPARTAKPAGKNVSADCKTPFIIDSKGVKIPKMHCLK
jgi:hypothetical protein